MGIRSDVAVALKKNVFDNLSEESKRAFFFIHKGLSGIILSTTTWWRSMMNWKITLIMKTSLLSRRAMTTRSPKRAI